MKAKEEKKYINGLELAYQTWGARSGPKLIALHGWLDNSDSFRELAPLLADQYEITAVDLPGHGRSAHLSPHGHYQLLDSLPTILRLADELKIEKLNLIGHSLGGVIGSLLAGAFPERIKSVVSIEAIGPLSDDPSKAAEVFAKSVRQYQGYDLHRAQNTSYSSVEEMIERRVKVSDFDFNIGEKFVPRSIMKKGDRYFWTSDPRLRLPSRVRLTERQVESFLSRIQCPFQFIRAKPGIPIPDAAMHSRINLIQDIQMHMIEGGHHVHIEKPDHTAKLIKSFLKKVI